MMRGYAQAFRTEILWVAIFSLIANLLTLAPTLYMLQVFDRVMQSQNEFTLMALTLILVIFIGVMAFAEFIRSRLLVRAGMRFDEMISPRLFVAGFDAQLAQPTAQGMHAFSELTRLRQFVTGSGVIAMFDLPWSMIYVAVLFIMHPWLGWAALVFTLFLGGVAWFNHHVSTAAIDAATEQETAAHSWLAGKLRNAEVVEAMGMLDNFRQQWKARHRRLVESQALAQHRQTSTSALAKFIQYAQQSLILSIGAWLVIRGELGIGAMIASNLLMGNALRPIASLVKTWKEFVHARHAAHVVGQMLARHEMPSANHVADKIAGTITLHKLSAFRPAGSGQQREPILNELDIEFSAGEVIAIVGPSGAGKSTLLRCLLGIWPDAEGSVRLDGIDIHDWSREQLGKRIGYLPQDIELFEGTIAENIGRFEMTVRGLDAEAIVEAAKRADIHPMILRLPQGYDTPIGVAGQLLSAGQRQRLALARALYGSPDIVVLDEPNANLDDAGELALGNAIRDLRATGKTVFMVLHQRSLLALADRVLAMAEGRITTYGKIEMPAAAQANAAQPDAQRETSSECASDSGANTMPPAMTH
jgi:ATP-binding cassette subfamily C exporter for protease/lipase